MFETLHKYLGKVTQPLIMSWPSCIAYVVVFARDTSQYFLQRCLMCGRKKQQADLDARDDDLFFHTTEHVDDGAMLSS